MAAAPPRYEQLASVLTALSELAVAVCMWPCGDQRADPRTRAEAEEFLELARDIKAKLDVFLTDEVRADLVTLIEHLDQNRDRYRQAILRWVDLLEEIAHFAEEKYGDGAGPLKQREVRAAVYYLVDNFFGPQGLPTVPPFLRPIVLELITRLTVEFLVTLDNPGTDEGLALWGGVRERGQPNVRLKSSRAKFARYRETMGERFVGWLVRIFLKPRFVLTGELKTRVDAIVADWAERNRLTGTFPAQRAVEPLVQTAIWVGEHADQVRAAVDAVAMATYATARFTRMEKEEQLEVVKEAVVIMFEDLGYTGPMFRTVVRFSVDMMSDATDNLFRKRGVIRE
jgi:hypothetical protein